MDYGMRRALGAMVCVCLWAAVLPAAEQWQSRGGRSQWRSGDEASASPGHVEEGKLGAGSSLQLLARAGQLLPAAGGQLELSLDLPGLGRTDLLLRDGSPRDLESWLLLDKGGRLLAQARDVKLAFDPGLGQLTLYLDRLELDGKVAADLGQAASAGHSLGSLLLEIELAWSGGDPPAPAPIWTPGEAQAGGERVSNGADMRFCQLYGLYQHGRTGSFARLAVGTTSWNVGNRDLQWTSGLGNRHPYIVQNLYRLENGRLEQIAASWIKHGFYALASHQCDLLDLPDCVFEAGHGAGGWLGQGCTDTYSPSLNASGLRPRSEINPWTGVWAGQTYSGDYSLWADDADIDPAQHPGAVYYAEGLYNVADDVDPLNSISWKPVTFTGSPGGSWTIGMSAAAILPTEGPVLEGWGQRRTLVAQEIPVVHENAGGGADSPDGRAVLAVSSTDNGDGSWHYEYVLLNVDMARRIDSFSLPLGSATVQNIGFHSPTQYDPGFSNTAWSSSVQAGVLSWSTSDNPIRWGTAYTFRFDSNSPPAELTAQVGLQLTGGPAELAALTNGPAGGPADCNANGLPDDQDIAGGFSLDCDSNGVPDECQADCNGNGQPDNCDIAQGGSQDCNANGQPDECESASDCNGNGRPDSCDIAQGSSQDCNGDGLPDECQSLPDCDADGQSDVCEIGGGAADCNVNGVPDSCDISSGSSQDVDLNGVPDECEGVCGRLICPSSTPLMGSTTGKQPGENHGSSSCGSSGSSPDVFYTYQPALSGTATLQTCGLGDYDTVLSIHSACPGTTANELACNDDNCADYRSLISWPVTAGQSYTIRVSGYNNASGAFGLLLDGPPCELNFPDCNGNLVDDALDIASGGSTDCNANQVPDECDISSGGSGDCNGNQLPDECDIAGGAGDCNANGIPDLCEFSGGGVVWTDHAWTGLALAIPDNNATGVSDTRTLPAGADIEALELGLQLAHTYNGDLSVTLTHLETGHSALVVDRIGRVDTGYGYNSDGFDVRLGDGYAAPIEGANVGNGNAVTGTWQPSPGLLSVFSHENPAGSWRLTVQDLAGSDLGQLQGWSLHLRSSTQPLNDCNGNGRLDECDITAGSSLDLNHNGSPDECDPVDPEVWTTENFASQAICNKCHNHGPAEGVFDHLGEDVSPLKLFEAGLMANSARDPYWRAKVRFEMAAHPTASGVIENTCLSCHAPMGHLENQMTGDGDYTLADLATDRAGREGVSCALCHQLDPANLGPSSWSGQFSIAGQRRIFGPFANPDGSAMSSITGFTPFEGSHLRESALCAGCHTLFTPTLDAQGQVVGSFAEQVPLLENLNSSLSAVSCQSCHMREFAEGDVLATFPPGLGLRVPTRGHDIVGGNTMMLELLRDNRAALSLTADSLQFAKTIQHTRDFLAEAVSLDVVLSDLGAGPVLDATLTNRTGHRFPTGIPVRRAWLEVLAYDEQENLLFHSGGVSVDGRISGHDAGVEPHHDLIDDPGQVQIWEGRVQDSDGVPTWSLMSAAGYAKDNRLPPAGWSPTGPEAQFTSPVGGCLGDADFHANGSGSDQVRYLLPAGVTHATVRLHFQSVNPLVVDAMRATSHSDVQDFLALWDAGERSGTVIVEMQSTLGAAGDALRGGRLYDRWWTETAQPAPVLDHPLWASRPDTLTHPGSGASTWRCSTCHGWDYQGELGEFGPGSPWHTGFGPASGTSLPLEDLVDLLRQPGSGSGSLPGGHGYGGLLTDSDLLDLAVFVRTATAEVDALATPQGVFTGNAATGGALYSSATTPSCAACHGPEGREIPFGPGDYLGEEARAWPWRTLHRVRFGPVGMPAMPRWHQVVGDLTGLADLGSYLQQLPLGIPTSAAQLSGGLVRVSWTPVPSATGYELRLRDAFGQEQSFSVPGGASDHYDFSGNWLLDAAWSLQVVARWDPPGAPTSAGPQGLRQPTAGH